MFFWGGSFFAYCPIFRFKIDQNKRVGVGLWMKLKRYAHGSLLNFHVGHSKTIFLHFFASQVSYEYWG